MVLYAPLVLPTSSAAVAVRCFHLARAMRHEGLDVEVWTHSNDSGERRLLLGAAQNTWPTPLRMLWEAVVAVELVLRLLGRRLRASGTIVVLSSPPYVTCFLVAVACRMLGLRYAWDARDLYPEVLFNHGVIGRDGIGGRWLARRTVSVYRRALMVSTPSDAFARTLAGQVGDAAAITTVRNGFDEQLFKPAAHERPATAPFTCVNHGLLGRMHNIQLILDVAALVESHEGIRFIVVGYGPKEPLLRSHRLKNLTFLGPMAYERIPALLAEADLGIAFIESNEGTDGAFPVKVYEYIGAGLPTLVTPVSEAGRLVEERGVGLAFGNEDAAAIAARLIALAGRSEELRAMRQRCRDIRLDYSRERASAIFARQLVERSDRTQR